MTSPGGGGGGFAESVTNGDKGGRGLLVGGDVTTEKIPIHIFWFRPSKRAILTRKYHNQIPYKLFLACSWSETRSPGVYFVLDL